MAGLILAAAAAASAGTLSGPAEAVDRCVAAQSARPFDFAALSTGGWSEGTIAGVEAAPGGSAGHRMFNRPEAGAVILVKTEQGATRSDCHVIFRRSNGEVDRVETEIGTYFGEEPLKLGAGMTMFRTTGKPVLVTLTRKPDKGAVLADIAILPFEPKAASNKADDGQKVETNK
jgi:hypothetical protein